jgi:hypothetical protein
MGKNKLDFGRLFGRGDQSLNLDGESAKSRRAASDNGKREPDTRTKRKVKTK